MRARQRQLRDRRRRLWAACYGATTFLGTNSTQWDDATNWDNGLPDATTDAIVVSIPVTASGTPVECAALLASGTVEVSNFSSCAVTCNYLGGFIIDASINQSASPYLQVNFRDGMGGGNGDAQFAACTITADPSVGRKLYGSGDTWNAVTADELDETDGTFSTSGAAWSATITLHSSATFTSGSYTTLHADFIIAGAGLLFGNLYAPGIYNGTVGTLYGTAPTLTIPAEGTYSSVQSDGTAKITNFNFVDASGTIKLTITAPEEINVKSGSGTYALNGSDLTPSEPAGGGILRVGSSGGFNS